MATEEKLLKALENLKCTDFTNDTSQRNKERIQNCLYVADAISSSTIKVLPNFHQLLSTTFETLFQMCDDTDSDVRLVTDESLNRIIKAMDNENMNKVLIELHREIKRNGAARSLKAALSRFSNLADLIRLPKRKQYLINFIPCIVQIAQRNEELLHEILADNLSKILKSLGNFLSDSDVKMLLEAFLKNIDNISTVIRRTSINCLLVTCINCRRPHTFLLYLLDTLLNLLTSVGARADVFLVLGVLGGLKQLIPYIKNVENQQEIQGSFGIIKKMTEIKVNTEKLLQVYDICLHFLLCAHDSVTSASLDTLNSLLLNCTPETKNLLLSTNGIRHNRLLLPSHIYLRGTILEATDKVLKYPENSLPCTSSITDDDGNMDKLLPIKNIRETCFEDVNIGMFEDSDVSLIFCVRLICRTCLLTGQRGCTIPDSNVRISVKNLALTCMVSLFGLYPKAFLYYLSKSITITPSENKTAKQPITDILLLAKHTDPQLRGAVRIVVASFIKAMVVESNGSYISWFVSLQKRSDFEILSPKRLLSFLIEGLLDCSSSCVRQSLSGLNFCLKYVLSSSSFKLAVPILDLLPAMAVNSHWLVKVKLLDIIVEIPFLSIHSINGSEHFQNKLIFGLIFDLLRDHDQRVRTSASNAIVRIVPSLYFSQRKTVEVAAIEHINMYFFDVNSSVAPEIVKAMEDDLPFPFCALDTPKKADVELGLSKIICELHRLLLENFADSAIYGYVEVLTCLSLKYPSTVYSDAWNINSRSNLLNMAHSLLQQEFIYDINCHIHVLQLCGNLLSGRCADSLRDVKIDTKIRRLPWSMFSEKRLQEMCESFLTHLVKLLNILVHIMDDAPLSDQKFTTLTSIAAAAGPSPVKSKKSNETDKNIEKKTTIEEEQQEGAEKSDKKGEPTKAAGMGHFSGSVHYVKVYDVLKVAYEKYKITLSYDGPENIVKFSSSVLTALSQILEIATVAETSRIADEILGYLQTIFNVVPSPTVHCVNRLLKSLFGSNLTMSVHYSDAPTRPTEYKNSVIKEVTNLNQVLLSRYGYENVLDNFNILAPTSWASFRASSGDNSPVFSKHSQNLRESQRGLTKSDKTLAGYIRLFEPMVIKSLKHYTVTSNVDLQCAVLHLLNQLVRLKVNYCLLDSEQVFIKFIQKQFEFIEEGLIEYPSKLIPKIFEFLTNLSHGKQHSKSIIAVPKVIQLCDGLMASGQSPVTYCIPALKPIVEELFPVRNRSNTADFSELETTREVLLSMLLRLFEYADVMDLLAVILTDSRQSGNKEKLSKWSKQVFDVFLVQLAGDKLKLDNAVTMVSLLKLVGTLDPVTVQMVNELLKMLFRRFPAKNENESSVSSWLGKILIILVMIVRLQENVLLKGIRDSSGNFAPECVFDRMSVKSDPLNVTNVGTCFEGLAADTIFVKFLFRTLELISRKCRSVITDEEGHCFLVEQLSHLLFIFGYIFRAGNHHVLVDSATRLMGQQSPSDYGISHILKHINVNLVEVSKRVPPIAYQWCSVLVALECRSKCFWDILIDLDHDAATTQGSFDELESLPEDFDCLYRVLPNSTAALALCEYLVESDRESDELLLWFIAREPYLMTWLREEPPVSELIRYVQDDPQLSARFVQSILSVPASNLQPHLALKLLSVLRDCHLSQSGQTIQFLVKNLLNRQHLALMRAVVNLTCRKLEYLLTLDNAEIRRQLSEENLRGIIEHILSNDVARKNETIIGLLTKLASQVCYCIPVELNYRKNAIDTTRLRTLEIDRDWYLTQLISKRCLYGKKSEMVSAFTKIEVGSVTVMPDEYSKRLVLRSVLSCADRFSTSEMGEAENLLLMESLEVGFSDLLAFLRVLPRVHQVYLPEEREPFNGEVMYARQLTDAFAKKTIWRDLQDLISVARDCAISSETGLSERIASMNLSIIMRFCVTSLESVLYNLARQKAAEISMDHIECVLTCTDEIFSLPTHLSILELDAHLSWLSSSVNVLFKVVSFLFPRTEKDSLDIEDYFPPRETSGESYVIAKHTVCQLATVFTTVVENRMKNVPDLLRKTVTSITMRLAKLPAFNSYLSTPPSIWKGSHPWTPEFGGPFHTQVPPLPVEFLRDSDILQEYNFRINRLGWSNRQQFEETWMSLLSTLNTSLIEDNESGHLTICFAVKAITALLARTFYIPIQDNNNNNPTVLFHVPRDSPVDAATNKTITKLKYVQDRFEKSFRKEAEFVRDSDLILNVFDKPNVEKCENTRHSCGQVCVAYLLLSSGTVAEDSVNDSNLRLIYEKRRRSLEEYGLDLNSCIQSLLDLYTLWINTQNTRSPTVLDDILKSLLVISDLFQQKSQFVWLLDTCVELSKDSVLENEITCQYLLVALCKAAALLNPEMEIYELIKKLLSQSMKSSNLTLRISCLHGLLYVVEGCVLTNTVIGGISEELQLLLPIAIEYLSVQNNWNIIGAQNRSLEHDLTAWALIFFMIETISEDYLPPGFVTTAIQTVISVLKTKTLPLNVYSSLIKALERLMAKRCLSPNLREYVTKLAVDKIKDSDASHSLFAVQLLLTCMYSDCLENRGDKLSDGEYTNDDNPDNLVQIVEKVSVIFDRIKKGLAFEVEILCQILPDVINDFFSPSDILTKVVGEFLSPQQKHPALFSGVVFKVFENGIARSHLTLLQDWVVVSLSNFAQTVSVGMAIWYLTCFFISTSTNFWLRSVFPYVRSRIGRFETEDVEMLCITGRDFYNNLTTDKQRRIFVDAFKKADLQCDTPFKDLLECIGELEVEK